MIDYFKELKFILNTISGTIYSYFFMGTNYPYFEIYFVKKIYMFVANRWISRERLKFVSK